MKKIISSLSLCMLFVGGLSAQGEGQLNASGGLAIGTEAGINDNGSASIGFGFNLGAEYFVTDIISVAPSYTYFFKDEIDEAGISASVRLSALNFDGRYYFLTDEINVYGLLGGSILFGRFESEVDFLGFRQRVKDTDSEFGLNIGGGLVYPLEDGFSLGGQVKYQTAGDGQLVFNASLIYAIDY
jgi:opacity protein-like surface antigen